MSDLANCQKCGQPLKRDALQGLCAKCLASLAFLPGDESDGSSTNFPRFAFGDYELIEEIARGGMGVVYKANQKKLNRLVALKMILHGPFSSAEFVQRFQTEAETVARLKHPNIVTIYEIGERDGHHYIAMELINGRNMAEVVRDKPLEPLRAAIYLQTVARAIHYAHQTGVVHRDLKPSNLLLDLLDQPHVTDFGLAKLLSADSSITVTGQALGSPGYMAPEQLNGSRELNGILADVYSLGAVLYHLLTGRSPFQGETLQNVLQQVHDTEPVAVRRLNPAVPVSLETICLKCLQKDPEKRYASAGDFAGDLERFINGEPIVAQPVSRFEKLLMWSRRRPIQSALTISLALAILLGLLGIFLEWRKAEANAAGESAQRKAAQASAENMRLNLYAADIHLAASAIEQSDFGHAREILSALVPKPGESDIRGFEWRYLFDACRGANLATFSGHEWIVTCAAFSPDGKKLLTGSQDGTAKLWDIQSRTLLHTFGGHTASVWSVDFIGDGSRLMIAGNERGTEIWDSESFRKIASLPGQIAAISHTTPVLATAESSKFFYEQCGKVSLWNFNTMEKIGELPGPGRAVAFSADGKILATATSSNGLDLWDVSKLKLIKSFKTRQPVWSLAFSPITNQLIANGWSADFLVWDLDKNTVPRIISGHMKNIWDVSYSRDGKTIATASSDQTIRLWDAETFEQKVSLTGHGNEVWCAVFSPDGNTLASGSKDTTVKLWSTHEKQTSDSLTNVSMERPVFSKDGKKVLFFRDDPDSWKSSVWDLVNRSNIGVLSGLYASSFSDDGSKVAGLNREHDALVWWDLKDMSGITIPLESLDASAIEPIRSGLSQSLKSFYAIDQKGVIRVWRAADGKLINMFPGPTPPLRSVSISPDGSLLAISIEKESAARLYEIRTGNLMILSGHHDYVSGFAFSHDGRVLATGSVDGTVKIWNTVNGSIIDSLPGQMEEATDIAFSPDGQTLAAVCQGESVCFWHMPTHRELFTIRMPKAGLRLQFSPDGKSLAVNQIDNSLRFLKAPWPEEQSPPNE